MLRDLIPVLSGINNPLISFIKDASKLVMLIPVLYFKYNSMTST